MQEEEQELEQEERSRKALKRRTMPTKRETVMKTKDKKRILKL